ncbi:putative phosphodiesterase [Rhizobium sp. BK313]|nr:putative phosphodiesterase [Rhizobium sp. BK313]
MIDDVRDMVERLDRKIDVILISGDIAFAGKEEEYDFALRWIRDSLCPASGCEPEDVIVIPGNHDVDRKVGNSALYAGARELLRDRPLDKANDAITKYMDDGESSKALFSRIENYNRFAARFLCEVGKFDKVSGKMPFVRRDFELNDKSTLRVWGFNSVLVCDEHDKPEKMFVDPSAAQIERGGPNVAHLVMCHHPFNWLRNAQPFQDRVEKIAKVHLFGHEHTLRVNPSVNFTRIKAGALQPDRDEPNWKPGYNIIDIDVQGTDAKRELRIEIWVRQHELGKFRALPDDDDNMTWEFTHKLATWTEPVSAVAAPVEQPAIPLVKEEVKVSGKPPTARSVAFKMLDLAAADQKAIIKSLALGGDGDKGLLDYESALAAIRRAEDKGVLVELDRAIDEKQTSRSANG